MKICLEVIIENREKEASVTSHLEEQIWIVTGKGNDFQYFPIPAKSHSPEIKLQSKQLIPWIPHITKYVHFLLCLKDGSVSGRWEGESFTVEGLGNEFSLVLEQREGEDIKIQVEHPVHEEGRAGKVSYGKCKLHFRSQYAPSQNHSGNI